MTDLTSAPLKDSATLEQVVVEHQVNRVSPSDAMHKVFAVPELVDLVLQYLSVKEIHSVKRTCSIIHSTVQGSRVVAKRLMLVPQPTPSYQTLIVANLMDQYCDVVNDRTMTTIRAGVSAPYTTFTVTEFMVKNPYIFLEHPKLRDDNFVHRRPKPPQSSASILLDMFLTRPPALDAIVTRRYVGWSHNQEVLIHARDGLRLRHVIAALKDRASVKTIRDKEWDPFDAVTVSFPSLHVIDESKVSPLDQALDSPELLPDWRDRIASDFMLASDSYSVPRTLRFFDFAQ